MNVTPTILHLGTQNPKSRIQHSIAAPFFLAALLLVALLSPAKAEPPNDPVFAGQSITINGIEYTFYTAAESEVTANNATFTVHTDTYVSAEGYVFLQGRLADPQPALASVSGEEGGSFSGIWSGGGYFADGYFPRSSGASYTLPGGNAAWASGGDFKGFTLDWQLQTVGCKDHYIIEGNQGTFVTDTNAGGTGSISGGRSGAVINGSLYLNGSITSSVSGGRDSYALFGATYAITRVEYEAQDGGGSPFLVATEKYVAGNGGNLALRRPAVLSSPDSGTFTGNDPAMGTFGGSFISPETLVLDQDRADPTFAGRNLWVNSTLVTWSPSRIVNAAGGVADVYSGAMDGNTVTVTVSGDVPAFKRNENPVNPIVVVEVLNGAVPVTSASGTYVKSTPSYFDVPGWYVGAADHSRITPLCLPSVPNLWVNGTRYLFRGGVDDGAGNSVDTYLNPGAGQLVLIGNWTGATHSAVVRMSYQSAAYTGTYDAGRSAADVFDVRDGSDIPMPVADSGPTPSAFWVNGSLYRVSDGSNFDYADANHHPLTATVSGDGLQLSGGDAVSAFYGAWATGTALFRCTRTDGSGQTFAACPARWDGTLMLDATNAPTSLPPAIKIQGVICPYIGTSSEDENPAVSEAYYGHASSGSTGNLLLRIRLDDGTVTFTDFAASNAATGTYSTTTHLFQSAIGQIPAPIYGTDPCHNNERWLWLTPQNGRPATVRVAQEAWGYTHSDAAGDHYAGYYDGQEIIIANGRDGYGIVTLTMQSGGTLYSGTYYNNAFQMASGPTVASGDKAGTYVLPGLSLSTTGADLDVLGNLFSLGSLKSNANMVGLTLQFADVDGTAKLYSTLSRLQAEWTWNRADASPTAIAIPMMKLGSGNTLTLFDPADATKIPIVLNPNGRSRFDKPIRIAPQGDLDMGNFKSGPGEP